MSDSEEYPRPHKRHHHSTKKSSRPAKLQRYAALGEHQKLERLLHKHSPAVDARDFEGSTALHQAVRHGHPLVVDLLISAGADCRSEDFQGNTPAHIAASTGHLQLLSHLLKMSNAPDVAQQNAAGQTIEDLAEASMLKAELADRQETEEAGPSGSVWWDDADEDRDGQEYSWEQRLMDEALEGGAGAHVDDWYLYEDPVSFDGPQPVEGEDEEMYAQRIWEEMTQRKQGTHYAPSSRPGHRKGVVDKEEPMIGPKPASAAERKAQAAEEARERSDRILEEERAKDKAWRQAVLMGDVGAQRARYEARWATFVAQKSAAKLVPFKTIPWLVEGQADPERVKALVLHGTNGPKEVRKRLQAELIRWHPDKFTARWSSHLVPADQQRIMEGVGETSRVLTALLSTA
ncbi:hypothetical protein WJX84_009982 [Apatococcus fuscideae]|uniref:NF-kappa-B inhibitor-like protein 1 n=1 Tax=Apatococcus fuscideae TaxID=2026836 RepID=A0AAW1T239_9CHLO